MIELSVVSVAGGQGIVETIRIGMVDPEGVPRVEVRGIEDQGGIREQLARARQIAGFFLSQAYVKPATTQTLTRGTIVAEFKSGLPYTGESFGLAFLVGCLSLGFNVPVRKKLLYSAALGELLDAPGWAGGGLSFRPVAEVGGKLAAACIEQQSRLYFYSENEQVALDFEKAFWGGQSDRSCLPQLLPEYLPTSAILGLALDTEQLLNGAVFRQSTEPFVLLMLHSSTQLPRGECFPTGIGTVLSSLRGQGRLKHIPDLPILAKDLNLPQTQDGELFISVCLEQCIDNSPSESMRLDLVKAAISEDPTLGLFPAPATSGLRVEDPAASDLDGWLEREPDGDPYSLRRTLAVLALCDQLAPDMAAYWPKAKTVVLGLLQRELDCVIGLVERRLYPDAVGRVRLLTYGSRGTRSLGGYLGRLSQEWIPAARALVAQCFHTLQGKNCEPVLHTVKGLYDDLTAHYVPDVLRPLAAGQEEPLELAFRFARQLTKNQRSLSNYPRPPLTIVNDLELVISGPNKLSFVVPSPVLLLEHCSGQHGVFGRRRGMTLSDDTLNRYPLNDARVALDLFGNPFLPTRIGFCVDPTEGAKPAMVRWAPSVNPWPPAIDTQFLAAALVQYGQDIEPKCLLDVGCGTGFLSIAAARRWPTLKRLDLVDMDPLAVAAAEVNLDSDAAVGEIERILRSVDFKRFRGHRYDVILCAPPYLPERPLRVTGIEMATNGTLLLEEAVVRTPALGQELWIAFSAIAWPEFQRALARVADAYARIELLRRDFVPFRIPWLEPSDEEEKRNPGLFREKVKYYERVLAPRGLIDMDSHLNWYEQLRRFAPDLPDNFGKEYRCYPVPDDVERCLDKIEQDSRGYRFWHEVRVLRLRAK